MSPSAALIATATAAYAWRSAKRRDLPPTLVLSAIGLVTVQLLLIEQSVLGIPVRVLVFVTTAVALLAAGRNSTWLVATRTERAIAGAWALYMLAIVVTHVANGSFTGAADVVDLTSRYGFALLIFCVASALTRFPGGALVLCRWLVAVVLINLIFVGLQVLGISTSFALHADLFPVTKQREASLIEAGMITSFGYLPGLSPYSIFTGYVFSCLGLLAIGLAATRRGISGFAASSIAATSLLVGGVVILSRSTIIIAGSLGLLLLWRLLRPTGRLAVAGAALSILVIATSYSLSGAFSSALPDVSRLEALGDHRRTTLITAALPFIEDHLLLGASPEQREAAGLGIGAHNFLLNALLYFGLAGTTILLGFLLKSLVVARRCLEHARECARDYPLILASYCSMWAYLLKSLVHNDSLVTSGILYMLFLGIVVGAGNPVAHRPRLKSSTFRYSRRVGRSLAGEGLR